MSRQPTAPFLWEGGNIFVDGFSPDLPRGTLTQYAGQLHRLNTSKKDVMIFDYVDFDIPVLAKMYARRRAGYKSIG
ncbi:MAG: hypothetical protein WCA79_01880 [Anaerolineales bacterium]